MERQQLAYHGSTLSHLDALCHEFHECKVYNVVPVEEVFEEGGCTRMGISGLANGIVTRAVLLDIPQLTGLDALDDGTHVYPADIEAWEREAGIRILAGDVILLRTGRRVNWNSSGYDITVGVLARCRADGEPWRNRLTARSAGGLLAAELEPRPSRSLP